MQKRPALTIDYSAIGPASFVIDEVVLRHNLSILKHIREETGCKMFQALKTWSTYPLFSISKQYLDGTEVSSLNEARLGHDYFNDGVHMYAPAYSKDEFEQILSNSHTVIFNSFSQWTTFKPIVQEFTQRTGKIIECGLRLNPEYTCEDEHGDLWSPCAPGSRLGIRKSEFERELRNNPSALQGISGFHMHIFFDKHFNDLRNALSHTEKLFGEYFKEVAWVNMGGGQRITDDTYNVVGLITLIQEFQKRHQVTMHFEPGAAICRDAGALVANVLDIVERDDVPYKIAILDISFNAHTPDFLLSPDLDMPVLGAKVIREDFGKNDLGNLYQLAGGTCVTGDHLGHCHAFEKPLSRGDKVVLLDAIQYNMAQCTMFNGVQHPSIVHWNGTEAHTLRAFTYDDFKQRMA